MSSLWPQLGAGAGAAVGAAAGVSWLIRRGLRDLDIDPDIDPDMDGPGPSGLRVGAPVAGAVAGVAAVTASARAGSWWLLAGLLVWAVALVAAGCCDALTQRVPTPLVRQGGALSAALLAVGAALSTDWTGALRAAAAAAVSGVVLLLLWRFAGAGYGDVRLAVLGGLGLGHLRASGVSLALAGFVLVTLGQVLVVLARGGNRRSMLAYGPAMAVAFLLAAAG